MRESGILLPITSLPSRYGIGCFSAEAYEFVDLLAQAGQSCWQILPLGPVGYGDSPYQAFSTFAGNPYYICLETLVENGWLSQDELDGAGLEGEPGRVDYGLQYTARFPLLRKAHENSRIGDSPEFRAFCAERAHWIEDYALFMAIKDERGGQPWYEWDAPLRLRDAETLAERKAALAQQIEFWKFTQFEFYRQWKRLKDYANAAGIRIVGDIPIYVAPDSADIWANPELFQLDAEGRLAAVAGCPPDGFSATGQLWGNPLYDWPRHKATGYAWWLERLGSCFEIYDVVRIDHFRAFDEYFSIPADAATAAPGHWVPGPGMDFVNAVEAAYPGREIVAEDLGLMTDGVRQLVKDSGYPGMKLLEFGFDARYDGSASEYMVHNYAENSVAYTGTHDNETIHGWFCEGIQPAEREAVRDYFCAQSTPDSEMHKVLVSAAMRTVSRLCVIPLQDVLGLGNEARINTPSTPSGNWQWRLLPGQFAQKDVRWLREVTARYERLREQA